MAWFRLEMSIGNLDSYRVGEPVLSDAQGPEGSFRMRVHVFPRGRVQQDFRSMSVFLELLPPPLEQGSNWSCPDVELEIALKRQNDITGLPWRSRFSDVHTFTPESFDWGWDDFFRLRRLDRERGWLNERGEITLEAAARLPLPRNPHISGRPAIDSDALPAVNFEEEPVFVTFRLRGAPPVYFDKRLLVARSEYFRQMLADSRWREGRTHEVDLTSDPQASSRSMSSLLMFLTTNSFDAQGDADLAFAVRRLADRFSISELVDKAEAELQGLLCEDNALSFLGQVTGSQGRLERACLDMIQANQCELLDHHRRSLDTITVENPDLARQLFRLLLGTCRKRQRVS